MIDFSVSSTVFFFPNGKAWKPQTLPAFVISGQNPFYIAQPRHQNVILHHSLRNYLERFFPSCKKQEIIGQSLDGSWKEDSWVVYGLTMKEAKSIAKLFSQDSFFYFDDNGRIIIDCKEVN